MQHTSIYLSILMELILYNFWENNAIQLEMRLMTLQIIYHLPCFHQQKLLTTHNLHEILNWEQNVALVANGYSQLRCCVRKWSKFWSPILLVAPVHFVSCRYTKTINFIFSSFVVSWVRTYTSPITGSSTVSSQAQRRRILRKLKYISTHRRSEWEVLGSHPIVVDSQSRREISNPLCNLYNEIHAGCYQL